MEEGEERAARARGEHDLVEGLPDEPAPKPLACVVPAAREGERDEATAASWENAKAGSSRPSRRSWILWG
ncbi:MAG TPA: hypothetical protein VNI55_04755 [Gaiellaceae bacterium]|nr:hypothetical protein [Gaiellaceae bacterium]